jgi:hypothetical protein
LKALGIVFGIIMIAIALWIFSYTYGVYSTSPAWPPPIVFFIDFVGGAIAAVLGWAFIYKSVATRE